MRTLRRMAEPTEGDEWLLLSPGERSVQKPAAGFPRQELRNAAKGKVQPRGAAQPCI
jgi:hypothetical protein